MLKNVLSLLLSRFYSKKESSEVAHQSLPSTNSTYLFSGKSISDWGTVSTGVATYDGFLVLNVTGDGTVDTAAIFVSTPCVKSFITFPFSSASCATWAPIAKGEAWAVQGSNAKNISLRLYKTIGGGVVSALKNALLQGGVLCRLSRLYSSLLRSFCRVRKNGLLNNGTRRLRVWLIFLFQTTLTFILMFLQRTVCWRLGNLVRQDIVTWKSTPLVRGLISISQQALEEFTKVLQCRLIEANRFFSRQQQLTEEVIRPFNSSRLSVKREVGLGGASC